MDREGFDFSGKMPTAAALKTAVPPRDFVIRYARCFTYPKCIKAAEIAYWRANHIDIVSVDEMNAGRMLLGYGAGQDDASASRDAIREQGGPHDPVMYFACDVDTTSDTQRNLVDKFLEGAASVIGWPNTGLYGEWEVGNYAMAHTKLWRFWQTYAWSAGKVHPYAAIYQYSNNRTIGGVTVDFNRAKVADFGQWWYGGNSMTSPTIDEIGAEITKRLDTFQKQHLQGTLDRVKTLAETDIPALEAQLAEIKRIVGLGLSPIVSGDVSVSGTLHVTGQ